jgi:hypothetical protein
MMKTGILSTVACFLLMLSQVVSVEAAQHLSAKLSANPVNYAGSCPAKITFKGRIRASEPGRVQYKFIRSDGANAPVRTINFTQAGSKPVSTTWTLGGASLPSYSGWEAIQIVYPYSEQSKKAHFKVSCKDNTPRKRPDLIVSKINFSPGKPTTSDEITFWVFVKNAGNAKARPSMLSFKVGGESTPQHVKVPALDPGKEFRHQRRVKLAVAQNYQVTAKADSANSVKESNEGNNTMVKRFKVTQAQTAKLPDVVMKGFLKIGKRKREVKWNQTIVLTPADATLISNGKPAFDLYYACREHDGAATGTFKNRIYFNGKLVSSQTAISLTALQIKPIHTQAYLGPQDGKLQIKLDADNDVAESNESNNFHYYVNIEFQGF